MDCSGMDRESEALILELLLQDSRNLAGFTQFSRNGRDFTLALRLQQEELTTRSTCLEDQAMCLSLDRAIRSDGAQIQLALVEERDALADRIEACRLGGVEPPRLAIEPAPIVPTPNRLLAIEAPPTQLSLVPPGAHEDRAGGEETQVVVFTGQDEATGLLCVACQDYGSTNEVTAVTCGELYCRTCLQTMFESAFTDEERFPPRCCGQAILVPPAPNFLTPEIIHQHGEKKVEFETIDRTYCSSPSCSTFIKREHMEGDCGTCPVCATKTCIVCKAVWHAGDCPADTGLKLLLETAQREGWKRCICGRMVEHNLGCNHMTCPCGHHFCYECNAKWRTCTCPWFLEHRLLATAAARVAREDAPPAPGVALEQRIAEVRQTILQQHECEHEWTRINNADTCDECDTMMYRFLFVCDDCGRRRCADCRYD